MKNIIIFLFFLFFLSIFAIQNSFAAKKKSRFSTEDIETLGEYEYFSLPKGMMNKNQNVLKISAQNVLHRFVKKKHSLSLYPGKSIKAMAYFEILFNELLFDPVFKRDLVMDVVAGRNTFREAFGFSNKLSIKDATFRYWTLGELLEQGKVKKLSVPDDILDRKILLRDLKNRIGQLRSQIEFDTSVQDVSYEYNNPEKSSISTEKIESDNEIFKNYKSFCQRQNGTVFASLKANICQHKEISYDEFLYIKSNTSNNVSKIDKDETLSKIEERLKKLKNLFEKNLITIDEYEEKRKSILDEL